MHLKIKTSKIFKKVDTGTNAYPQNVFMFLCHFSLSLPVLGVVRARAVELFSNRYSLVGNSSKTFLTSTFILVQLSQRKVTCPAVSYSYRPSAVPTPGST